MMLAKFRFVSRRRNCILLIVYSRRQWQVKILLLNNTISARQNCKGIRFTKMSMRLSVLLDRENVFLADKS